MIILYHNPQWSKSRKSVEILNELKIDCKIIEYLKTGFTIKELKDISIKLNLKAHDFIRFNDKVFKDNPDFKNINEHKKLLELIIMHPKIIQRPIIINENKAIIARPPELIKVFLL